MARDPEYDVTLDGVGLILTRDGLGVSRVQANPYAMKSSSGERTYADLDEWAVFQVSSCHRGMGQERYGDPEQFWYATAGVDTRFKDEVFCGALVEGVDTTEDLGGAASTDDLFLTHFNDALYCGSVDTVYELVSNAWTSRDEVAGEDIYEMVTFNDYLYVARGANSMRKSIDGTTWTDVGGTPEAYDLYVHGGFLYRSTGTTLYYSNDPEAASPTWSTGITVGDSSQSIISLITYQNSLIVFKNDGAWRIPGNPGDLDTAYRVPELDWRAMIHSQNGKFCCVWSDGFLYVTAGSAGILRWTGRTVTPMGPDTLSASVVKGTPISLIPTPAFLYTALSNPGGTSHTLTWNGSGWHSMGSHALHESKILRYFDGYLYHGFFYAHTSNFNVVRKQYLPSDTLKPLLDTSYKYQGGYLYLPMFTANLHDTNKEFRSVTFWLDNQGGAATSGAQNIVFSYSVDCDTSIPPTGSVMSVTDGGQKIFKIEFDAPSFTDKQVASIDADRDTVTLTASDVVSDLSIYDWLYFADTNEYRYVVSTGGGAGAYTITLSCPLDSAPAANSYIRPGVPVGRYISMEIQVATADELRTPVVHAIALKYLVDIKDHDLWQLNVQVSDPLALRNGVMKRQPIADQLTRLDEIRKKGRVAFVDTMGDSHTVKVSNYSLQPTRQRTDERMEPIASYQAKLTLLEV